MAAVDVVLTSVVSTAQRRTKTMVFFLVSKSKTVSSWWVGLMGLASRILFYFGGF
jgi:hypothetical protein